MGIQSGSWIPQLYQSLLIKTPDPAAAGNMTTVGSLLKLGATREISKQIETGSIYLGEGFPPVPAKLVEKVRRGDFIKMYELLPDLWLQVEDRKTTIHSGRCH